MADASPLSVQELLDRCIDFLYKLDPDKSELDLRACALVSRSWASAAQPRLFEQISFLDLGMDSWPKLQTTLQSTPHLIPYIRRLHIIADISLDLFSSICSFPFTHLSRVFVTAISEPLSGPIALALRQLVSAPSLEGVALKCVVRQPAWLHQIWDVCSPRITWLDLQYYFLDTENYDLDFQSYSPTAPFSRLESLQISIPRAPLLEEIARYNLSHLRVLSIRAASRLWKTVTPPLPALVALNVDPLTEDPIDLSLFPALVLFRLGSFDLQLALDSFSTITATSQIRRIVIAGASFLEDAEFARLDVALSGLPVAHLLVVELEMETGNYELVGPAFPRLGARNLLCRGEVNDFSGGWFQSFSLGSLSL
ncbi:hypothetical protein B0H15DRAFT_869062 [Mycena belliarum]|uniref:F-box domain-containing protein n=1 Tax=Mycena belliarum TaxID=1033014 RepID=A0AAD6XEJ3_9AGAR|nr:hypothetical protein B0H15DRAFT_869062 [Mycena belliae]